MTYIKKNNYSSPTLNLENCKTILKNKDKYSEKELNNIYFVRQLNTTLINDGKEIKEQIIDVDKLYSSTAMKKIKFKVNVMRYELKFIFDNNQLNDFQDWLLQNSSFKKNMKIGLLIVYILTI